MSAERFDPSGVVQGVYQHGVRESYFWSELSPFTQGYVEALFAALYDPKNRGWEYSPAHNGYIHPNHRHGPNHRGLMAGWDQYPSEVSAEEAWDIDHYRVDKPAFHHLAPETLARIMEDCERLKERLQSDDTADAGWSAWRMRQQGDFVGGLFLSPPLTPYLGEDGKVHFKERTHP